jgi:hypothetical protein
VEWTRGFLRDSAERGVVLIGTSLKFAKTAKTFLLNGVSAK